MKKMMFFVFFAVFVAMFCSTPALAAGCDCGILDCRCDGFANCTCNQLWKIQDESVGSTTVSSVISWHYDGVGWWYGNNQLYKTGYCKIDDTGYFFAADGHMATGWQNIKKGRFYFDPKSGKQKKGWLSLNGQKYYLQKKYGDMAKSGWVKVGKHLYYFNADGTLFTNGTTPDGFRVDKKGRLKR